MTRFLALLFFLILIMPVRAQQGQAWYPLRADDGSPVANHPVPNDLEADIAGLPGIAVVGNPHGDVTLVEFYDVNCPFCRAAAPDIAALVKADHDLKLVLVPFPVLGIPSIQATRVELALIGTVPAQTFYAFHRNLYAGRGVADGERALATAVALGFDRQKLVAAANTDATTEAMKAHVRLGDRLGLAATPAFVIKSTAIVGYPGPRSLAGIVSAVRRCDKITC
jgi:protein-disulfide isomerase